MSTTDIFNKLLAADALLKLTDLRKDILKIFILSKKSISAYEVLNRLKKKRPKAEPPTVYRVIDYFVDKKIIHRIDAENKYVFCTQLDHPKLAHHGIMLICTQCFASEEITHSVFTDYLKTISLQHHFMPSDALVEIKGVCQLCALKK